MEQQLAKLAAPFRERKRAETVTVEQVQMALATNEVLVELVRFLPVAVSDQKKQGKSATPNTQHVPREYAAIVLNHASTNPVVLTLGNAEEIDEQVHRLQAAMRAGEATADILAGLYKQVWAPLADHIKGYRRVIVGPDGELNFLPFAALITTEGKYLCEQYEIGYVASGRDLIKRFDEPATNMPSLFGDPAFGEEERISDYLDRSLTFRSAFHDKDREALDGVRFPALPGTRKEVDGLKVVFEAVPIRTSVYLGLDATEGQLKSLNRPEILHLATHGYCLPDLKEEMPNRLRMMSMGEREGTREGPVRNENPLLRSGLALTGAGLALAKKAEVGAGKDDGIVTAEEVSSLDLWGTKLVVLSACDTGMGEARAGEGVMGLRRAFVQAGAKNLLMTLWPVQDDATGELMVDYYRKYLKTDDAIGAMNTVQRAAIAKSKAAGEQPNPRIWGPFLVSVQGSSCGPNVEEAAQ
jgi:CHAT domain-containing protein